MVGLFSCVVGMLLDGRAEFVFVDRGEFLGTRNEERGTRNEEWVSMTCLTREELLFRWLYTWSRMR